MSQDSMPGAKPPAKASLINDPKVRSLVFQVLVIVFLGWFFWTIFQNMLQNMESRGITTGFAFLSNPAGFEVLMSLIPYDATNTYGRTFVVGLLNTLLVSVLGIVFATIIGFIMGVARLSQNWLIKKIATVYIETFRNIPVLLQIFFWYFAVIQPLPSPRQSLEFGDSVFLNNRGLYIPDFIAEPGFGFVLIALAIGVVATFFMRRWAQTRQKMTGEQFPVWWATLGLIVGFPLVVFFIMGAPITTQYPELKGFNFRGGIGIIPELVALWLALSIYTATYIAEIVRSGIEAVNKGQTEAAQSLGIKNNVTLRLIIIPQAMRVIIPPLTSQYLNLAKNSSLATAIGYPDLVAVYMGTTLNVTGQAVEIVATTMAVYLTMSLTISVLMNWYNNSMSLKER